MKYLRAQFEVLQRQLHVFRDSAEALVYLRLPPSTLEDNTHLCMQNAKHRSAGIVELGYV
jgi:hypothetical protein